MSLEALRSLYLQKFGRPLETGPDVGITTHFELERDKLHGTYLIRYYIRQDLTKQRDELYENCLECLRLHPEEKVHIWAIIDSSDAMIIFTDTAVKNIIGVIPPPEKFTLKPGEGLSAFQFLNTWNLLPLVEYLQSKKNDPQLLISESGGEVEVTELSGVFVRKVRISIISGLNLSIKEGKLIQLIIEGHFDLTVASLIAIYRGFNKVYIPYDDANVYTFNEDGQKGNYRLSVMIFSKDGHQGQDEMKVTRLWLHFP